MNNTQPGRVHVYDYYETGNVLLHDALDIMGFYSEAGPVYA